MLTNPFIVLFAGSILLAIRLTQRKLLGVAIGALGAIILILKNSSSVSGESYLLGDLFIFINAASYAVYLVLVKPLITKYHPFTILAWAFTCGAMIVIPIGAFQLDEIQWQTFLPGTWLAFAYVLVFTTLFAYMLNAFALKKVSSATASIYIYLQPLIAGSISIFVGQDKLHWSMVISAILIFTGVYMVSAPAKSKN